MKKSSYLLLLGCLLILFVQQLWEKQSLKKELLAMGQRVDQLEQKMQGIELSNVEIERENQQIEWENVQIEKENNAIDSPLRP